MSRKRYEGRRDFTVAQVAAAFRLPPQHVNCPCAFQHIGPSPIADTAAALLVAGAIERYQQAMWNQVAGQLLAHVEELVHQVEALAALEERRWAGPIAQLFRGRPGIRFADLMNVRRN